MSLQIGKAIYHLLSKDSRIKEKVGSKIYPLIVEESTTFPFIIYKRTNISPNYTKGSYSVNESVTVDVVIASKDYTDTVELADYVRDALEGRRGNIAGIEINDIRMISADQEYIEDTSKQKRTIDQMANKILRGNDLMIFKDTTGAGTAYKALAFSTSCQLSLTGNTLETSSKDGGKWTSKAVSKLSWSLTTDNLYSVEDFNALVNSWISREELTVAFAVCTNADSDTGLPADGWKIGGGYTGKVVITSITANAPDNDNATYSVTLEGTGALSPKVA